MAAALRFIRKWYSIPLLLLAWEICVGTGAIESRLLPGLGAVWAALSSEIANGVLVQHAAVTVGRALAGFALAAAVGVPLAAAMSRMPLFGRMFEPMFFFGYPVPKIALFPVFTFIFGIGSLSKTAFAFIECLYPIVVTSYLGIKGIRSRLLWTAQNMGADEITILRRVMLPAALPSIFAGLRIALPLAVVVVVVTEMIGDNQGLGYYVTIWSTRFRFANVYAGIITIGICGFVLDQLLGLFRSAVVKWEKDQPRFTRL